MDPITGFFTSIANFFNTNLGPVLALMGNTPLDLTTANDIVTMAWQLMTAVADGFLAIFAVIGIIQMLYGQQTGTAYMPPGQFFFKMILTILMVHLSYMLGQDLIILNNELCMIVMANVQQFVRQVNGGQLFNQSQGALLTAMLTIVFGITLIRVIVQAVKRIIFFNVLFSLSGPAFLCSFLPQTSAWFAFWARTYIVTIFTQFFQYLTFGLGLQFFIATKQNGFVGFIIAIAMLTMVAEIPALLQRFASTAGASAGGVGGLLRVGITAAMLFA